MRGRHIPRLCRMCDAPMAGQEGTCWHCGAVWGDRSVRPIPYARPDADDLADEGGRVAAEDSRLVGAVQ